MGTVVGALLIAAGLQAQAEPVSRCHPTFLQLVDRESYAQGTAVTEINMETSIFLLGCTEDLANISEEAISNLRMFLRESKMWGPISFYAASRLKEGRQKLKDDLNGLLGEDSITDVIVCIHHFEWTG